MENIRAIKIIITVQMGVLLGIPFFALAYDQHTTHPALTSEIVKFHNYSFPTIKLSDEEKSLVIQGSIDEDEGVRFLRHFYDPVHKRGLTLNDIHLPSDPQLAGIIFATQAPFASSKEWAESTSLQNSSGLFASLSQPVFSGEDDYSWERSIYEYAWGDRKRALLGLGHILHLLEDATVPDHTRNDPHPPFQEFLPGNTPEGLKVLAGFQASPYEMYTERYTINTIQTTDELIQENMKPAIRGSLGEYFDFLAAYSNNNFFSKDTISNDFFSYPSLKKLFPIKDKLGNYFATDDSGKILFKLEDIDGKIFPQLNDDFVLSSYFSHLSKQAVLNGAGTVKLFFDEVEKEKKTKTLYEKNKSWFSRQLDSVKNNVFGIAGVIYGTSVQPSDINDDTGESMQANELEIADAKTSQVITQEKNAIDPIPSAIQNTEPSIFQESKTMLIISTTTPQGASSTPIIEAPQSRVIFGGVAAPLLVSSDNLSTSTATSSESVSTSTPLDTAPPDITFSINECAGSFSVSGCVIATTTINLQWHSAASDFSSYSVTCTDGGVSCSGFLFSSTTATSTSFSTLDNHIYRFIATAEDTSHNQASTTISVEIQMIPIAINEVGWSGTNAGASDQWIELYNNSAESINLAGYTLDSSVPLGIHASLSGVIPAHGYYLIESTADTVISNISADLVISFGTGLSPVGEILSLNRSSTLMDQTSNLCGVLSQWCGGDLNQKFSMERNDTHVAGITSSNWGTNNTIIHNGRDSGNNPIWGTPKARNSVQHALRSGTISNDTIFTSAESPYVITGNLTIALGKTLTIQAGTAVKFSGAYSLFVDGALQSNGTSDNPIVITSIRDNAYGGDLNGNGSSSVPAAQDWNSIEFRSGSSNVSLIDHTLIRYGGVIADSGTSPTVQSSTVEYAYQSGILLQNSSSTIQNTIVRNITGDSSSAGIYIQGGHDTVSGSTITNNGIGLKIDTAARPTVSSNVFSGNTTYPILVSSAYPVVNDNTVSGNALNGIILNGVISEDTTFSGTVPYIIPTNGTLSVASGRTLTVNPDVVVKFQNNLGRLIINGVLNATGSLGHEAIFTSFADDGHGGDTNADGPSSGAPGEAGQVIISSGSGTSTISYAKFLYGGSFFAGGSVPGASLEISSANAVISHATFQQNDRRGLWLLSSSGSIITDSLFSDHMGTNASALYVESSFPTVGNLTFRNNRIAISGQFSEVTVSSPIDIDSSNLTAVSPSNILH